MGQGSARPVILPQPLSIGYFQAIMKGWNSVHGSRHLRPAWGDFTQPFRASVQYRPDPDGLYQTWWWVPPHSITRRHVRFLRLRPADGVRLQPPIWAAESTSHPLHYLGHNALLCRHIPTQGLILLLCLAFMTAQWLGCLAASGGMGEVVHKHTATATARS